MSTRSLPPSQVPSTPWRRPALIALISSGVVLLVAVAAPAFAVRPALVGALALGVIACLLAVRGHRELDETLRSRAGEELLETVRDHGRRMTAERTRTGEVIGTLRVQLDRRDQLIARLDDQVAAGRRDHAEQRRAIELIERDRASLRREVAGHQVTIDTLRATLTARDAELAALLGEADDAELYTMPRRVRTDARGGEEFDVVATDTAVIDLQTVQTAYPTPAGSDRTRRQA